MSSKKKFVTLGVDIPEQGSYTLNIEDMDGFSKKDEIILVDKLLSKRHLLSSEPYFFESGITHDDARFEIHINGNSVNTTSHSLLSDNNFGVDKDGIVFFGTSSKYHVMVTDLPYGVRHGSHEGKQKLSRRPLEC